MADSADVKKLKARIAELEQQLAEEREEFEWDLKASKETGEATVRKLKQEIEELKQAGPDKAAVGAVAKSGDLEMLSKRALMAERKVAELQEELKRNRPLVPPPVPREDSFQRQRAESAEREREELRREKRALERSLREKDSLVGRLQKELDETKTLKGELENAKRELGERDQQLRQATQASADTDELTAQLESAKSDVAEKEKRIAELAEELNSLASVESERDALSGELEQLKAGLAQGGKTEQEQAQKVTQLETEVSNLKQELAKLGVASGQMMEQRERESQRLKTDLDRLRQQGSDSSRQLMKARQENTKLRNELGVLGRERDELVAQLSHLREREQTHVSPQQQHAASPGADPFDVKTVKSSMPAGSAGPDAAQPFAAATPDEAVAPEAASMPVVTGEMVQPTVDQAEEVFDEQHLSEEVKTDRAIPQPNIQTVPAGRPLPDPPIAASADQSAPLADEDEEEQDEPQTEELEPLTADEIAGHQGQNLEGQAELDNLPDLDSSVDEAAGQFFATSQTQPQPGQQQEQPPAEGGLAEVSPEVSPDSSVIVERDAEKPAVPKHARPPKKSAAGLVVKIVVFGGLAAALVVGAWHFFPIWFGVGGLENKPGPVAVSGPSDGGAQPADLPAAADQSSDASIAAADAGTQAAGTQADAGSQPDAGSVADQPPDQPEPSAKLLRARAFGMKLLKRKRFAKAEKFTRGWVETHPEDPVMHYLYGRALFYRGHRRPAAVQLEKAIEIDPQMFEAYYELGGIYLLMKKKDQACEALTAFMHMAPQHDRRVQGVKRHLKKMNCP